MVRLAAQLCNRQLVEIALTGGTDTSDLLGSFEQVDMQRYLQVLARLRLTSLDHCGGRMITDDSTMAGRIAI